MDIQNLNLPVWLVTLLNSAPEYKIYNSSNELYDLTLSNGEIHEVSYEVDGKQVVEANVCKVRNGISANFPDPYLRRRDPDCLFIGDEKPTDKIYYKDRFGSEFEPLRKESFAWVQEQKLAVMFFRAGNPIVGVDVVVIAPANAAFFLFGISLLQGIISLDEAKENFNPKGVVYVAPPFRHTHFKGKQVVVHNRRDDIYELFAYNLYPGPSAKKGVYGMLLDIGEREGWVTAHSSTAQVLSPYDNITSFMHEGASGGGKSEMLQMMHRESDGRILLGENKITGQKLYVPIPHACKIMPVTDDMALCHPSLQKQNGKLTVIDGENAWFVRVNHIEEYGTDHILERITVQPSEKLMFLNIDAVPNSTALIWEPIMDEPGVPCPNPRVIIPRNIVPDIIQKPVTVDIRSFGVRAPLCTKENPSYGIVGVFHTLPPALAWLWRLVSPRGHGNPSIVDTTGMGVEGVGSYWPFATGKKAKQANLLLEQFVSCQNMLYTLTPNQHIGAWKCSFVPQQIMREYLTRRGNAKLSPKQQQPARFSLLGYELNNLTIEGTEIHDRFLKVYLQPEVGEEGYDAGAKILKSVFTKELQNVNRAELSKMGNLILDCFFEDGSAEDYENLLKY